MGEKPGYRIVTIPPLQETAEPDAKIIALAEKFRAFRLRSLQTAPDAFASNYETESKKGLEQTYQRLHNPKATCFVALKKSESPSVPVDEQDALDSLTQDTWLGTVVILGPQQDDGSNPREFKEDPFPAMTNGGELIKPTALVYRINGTFVDPDGRGLGLGVALMDAAMRKAEADAAKYNAACRVGLAVFGHNVAAKKMYQKAGFRVVEERPSRSRPGMTVVVMENVLVAGS